jgi:AcrR family transcriptional regulator
LVVGGPARRFDGGTAKPDNGGMVTEGAPAAGRGQRQNILDTALSLMAQRGVAGTSMRDLASATGLNVASLYHYFPSKQDLLVAVLAERGFLDEIAVTAPTPGDRTPVIELADLLNEILQSMLEVEDFIRLMLGEVMRNDETAVSVGHELIGATQASLEQWISDEQPSLAQGVGADAVARMLRATLIGLFFEHVAGVLGGDEPSAALRTRADELAAILHRND